MSVAKSRLLQTFRFLKSLNESRNPIPREISPDQEPLWLDRWPSHPFIEVRRGDRTDGDGPESGDAAMEPVIRVRRANTTECPKPPGVLDGWLTPGWESPEADVEVLASRNFSDKKTGTVSVAFEAVKERVAALNTWKSARAKWVAAERPAVAARRLYEGIYALWTRLQREGDRAELVLGEGLLELIDPLIRHPVLLQPVALEFNRSGPVPEFRFHTGTARAELNRALLREVPSIEPRMIAQIDKELETMPIEPLGGESTTGFLRRLVHGLFTQGEFHEDGPDSARPNRPTIRRKPVLFLRQRSAGLTSMLDKILEDLESTATEPPVGLCRIMGDENSPPAGPSSPTVERAAPVLTGPEPDILFSKPANEEQYQIAARLARSQAVLVQGPPGTGKTHTIANLLGHLLAQGKTVLVTAHTAKALRVLRDQVDEALRPLCLSVLESDANSQSQLQQAAQEIADRLARSDPAALRREAALLREKRRRLLDEAENLRRQLRDARFSEIDEIVLGGEALRPIDVAKQVQANAEIDGWIPGPLQPGVLCPLADTEVRQLYASNGTLTPSDLAVLSAAQPVLAKLVAPADFRQLAADRASARARAQAHRPDLWDASAGQGMTVTELQKIPLRVQAAARTLGEDSDWSREVLFAGWSGGALREAWTDLLASVDSLAQEAAAADRLVLAHGPELPEGWSPAELATKLAEIVAHLESGGTLGLRTKLTHRSWHQLQQVCRVEGRVPQTLGEFQALLAQARLEESRDRFAGRWQRQVERLGGPPFKTLGRRPERSAQAHAEEIRRLLDWRATVWEPLIAQLRAAGFRWDAWLAEHPPVPGDHGELTRLQGAGSEKLAAVVEAQAARMRLRGLSAAVERQRAYLAGFPQSRLGTALVRAQDEWDIEVYAKACHELARLEGLRSTYTARNALLVRLQRAAPSWAQAIVQREKPHDAAQPPGEPMAAWRWRQWYEELERRTNLSMPDLQERIGTVDDELRRLAAQIIEKETWAAQCERTGLREQQDLVGFVQTVRKMGQRTGKRMPELLRRAREKLATARRAVPVWIMPLSRVYESFDPRDQRFDVVIIDEASQSDVTALAALYMGNEHVVVGDQEQVTPDAIGQRVDSVERMIATELQSHGIPNSHLYDGQTSVYDLAEAAFGGVVALREHFRCVPEIIHFSNSLSYNLRMRPLREPSSAPVRPALVAHRVQGHRDGQRKTNEVEAEEIASLLIACLRDEDYARNDQGKPTTFGVISLLGEEQALLIETKLRRRLQPEDFDRHRLLCGNAAHFQGDERDVVYLSMVDGPPDDGTLRLLTGPRNMFRKRYNVAASRARNQLWVVHSLDPSAHLQPGDLRRRLIEHARDPAASLRALSEQGNRVESVFERQVFDRLHAAGYRVKPAWPVGAFRIDLVVEGTKRRLAVECDGERWHTHEELQRDLKRQAILERLGWVFARIRGNLFFRDPERAMVPVFARLNDLGIEPLGPTVEPAAADAGVVVERVRREAEKLREQWRRERPEQLAFGFSEATPQETEPAASSVSKAHLKEPITDAAVGPTIDHASVPVDRGQPGEGGVAIDSPPAEPVRPVTDPDEEKTLGALYREWRIGLEKLELKCGFKLPRPIDWNMTLREARSRYGGHRK